MGSLSFRVVIVDIEEGRSEEVLFELGKALDLQLAVAKRLVGALPATVDRPLPKEEADRLAAKLAAAGARVRLVEVVGAAAGEDRGEPEDEESEGEDEAPERDRGEGEEDEDEDESYGEDEDEDEDGGEDEDDEDDDGDRERAGAPRVRRRRLSSQRVVIVGSGIGFAAVVVALVLSSTSSRSGGGCSCGDQYRGPGANGQLANALPAVASRFARGFSADGQIAHGTLGPGETARLTERVEGGRCYVWIGLSPDGTDLDLALGEAGTAVSEDQANDNFPVVQHCVAGDTTLTLEAKMYSGSADWVIQRYALAGRRGADQVELLHEMHSKRILAGDVEPVSNLERFRLRSGEEKAISLTADADWCYVPLAVSPPGTDLDMFLVDPENRVVEQDQARDNFPMVRHCPIKAGTYTIRLLMYGGDGDVAFRLYRGKLGAGGMRSGGTVGTKK